MAKTAAPTAEDEGGDKRAASRRKGKADEKALERARKQYSQAVEGCKDNHDTYAEDCAFAASNDHWDAAVKTARGKHRPALTFNRSHVVVKLIVGDYRQNRLSLKCLPASGDADEETADTFAGLIRNIEASSNADAADVNALECAARGGFGYVRVVAEYAGDDTLRQELVVKPVHNPLCVKFDPLAREFARQDARFCFVDDLVPKEDFKAKYPEASTTWFDTLSADDKVHWMQGDLVRVAEWYEKEEQDVTVVAFESGLETVVESDEQLDALVAIGEVVSAKRKAKRTRVRHRKITAGNVLEDVLLPIPHIPVIPVLGEEVNVEGKVLLRGALYYSKDAQRMISYWNTAATETVALAPKARTMMTPEQYEGNEDTWDPSAPTNVALYNASGEATGQPLPGQISPPSQPVGEMAMAQGAENQFKSTSGVYDPQLGNRSAASSGVAIGALQKQGESTTFLWVDNLRKAIEWRGRILVAWIPHVYDTERVLRMLDLEGNPKTVVVNKRRHDAVTGVTRVLNSLNAGKYDLVVTTSPAVATQRLELLNAMQQVLPSLPIVGQVAADLLIKSMPFDGVDEIAERVKKALPPQVTGDDDPQAQAQAQAAQQQQVQQAQAMQQQAAQAQAAQAQAEQQNNADKARLEQIKTAGQIELQKGELALKREEQAIKQLELEIQKAQLLQQLSAPTPFPGNGASEPPERGNPNKTSTP